MVIFTKPTQYSFKGCCWRKYCLYCGSAVDVSIIFWHFYGVHHRVVRGGAGWMTVSLSVFPKDVLEHGRK